MKSTKKSLLLSTLSLILCFAMLLGTTYAWFTDEVKSGVNKIVAGNLDIDLEYLDTTGETATWKSVTEDVKLFDDNALWEPGHTEVAYLKLSNKGTLALKYQLAINIANEVAGTNVEGNSFKLSDYIKMGVVENWNGTTYDDRAVARAAVTETGNIATYTKSDKMLASAEALTFAIVAYMPDTVGNEANYKTGTTAPAIDLGITVVATQLTSESDSFGKDYDIETPWMGSAADVPAEVEGVITINSAEELAGFAKSVNSGNTYSGKTIKLGKDIDLNNMDWTPIGGDTMASYPGITFAGIFDGQNHTIRNLICSSNAPEIACAGLFGAITGTVKNVKLTNVNITSTHYAGAVVAYASKCGTVDNCHVNGGTITAEFELINGEYDNGDKAGGINGYGVKTITNCSVTGLTITGYRDIGGIAGCVDDATVTGNTVTDVVLVNNRTHNYKNYTTDSEFDVHEIIGEAMNSTTNTNNTSTNVTINKIAPVVVPEGKTAQEAVTEALTNAKAGDALILPATTEPLQLAPVVKENITIIGNGDTKINAVGTGNLASIPNGVTFEGIEITFGTNNYQGFHHAGKITFKNCKINGTCQTYGDMDFENCTFTAGQGSYSVWLYGSTCNFTNCHFYGVDRNTYIYPDGSTNDTIVTFTKCDFHMSGIDNDSTKSKSCVMLNQAQSNNGGRYILTMTDCTYDGYVNTTAAENIAGNTNYQGLYGIKHVTPNSSLIVNIQVPALVTINGTVVYNHPAA